MKKTKDSEFFFKLLPKGRKFLAFIRYPHFKELEKKFPIYIGSSKSNKTRPCIFWKTNEEAKEFYKLIFLISSKQIPITINLALCPERNKNCSDYHFYFNSYVFQTLDHKILLFKLKLPEILDEFINCGSYKNLEIFKNIEQNLKELALIIL
uniref:Uncharacterized protein n=1 Tax=Thermodesulfobacterium geofontis TaxID=1295609 RepID=A0A7V4JQX3_9BACT